MRRNMKRKKYNVQQSVINIFLLVSVIVVIFVLDKTLQPISISEQKPIQKVRILIVPGHEPDYGGAVFNGLKERDLTVKLGEDLIGLLRANDKYEVFVTRDTEKWNQTFADYFKNNWDEIISWQKNTKEQFSNLVLSGVKKQPVAAVVHNIPSFEVGTRIYGITKWANENDIDLVIHIHLNDYRGRSQKKVGKYFGFAMYVPARAYSNSAITDPIAEAIFQRLSEHSPVSNFGPELGGIIHDPKLIAVGQNDTAKAASILIEYGYIYEPQFTNPEIRSLALKDLANQTYLGIEDFFAYGK
jgi:N-acetylmuramoyl-L-alanine amidase